MKSLEIVVLLLYSICLVFIFCYSLVQAQLTWLYLRGKKSIPVNPEISDWPALTIQLPVYNEVYVVERLIDAIMALDYPPGKMQIQVLDDSTDTTSELIKNKVNYYRQQGYIIEHIRREQRIGYKAGALDYGLQTATGEFMAIFDADFLPFPDFLKQTLPAFTKPAIGMVQTRWAHLNQDYSLLTQLQAFGLNAHFIIEQGGRQAGHHFINFNGTAGVWRKKCIQDAGGWQADTLTEDLDLSYRAQLKHWEFVYLEHTNAPAELPASMPALKSQQFRWTKGAAETARKNLRKVLAAPLPVSTKINALFHLLNSSVFICILISAFLSLPLLFIQQRHPDWPWPGSSGIFVIFSLTGIIVFYWISFRRTNSAASLAAIFIFIPRFLLFLSVMMGLSLHNSIAVLEGYLNIRTPFIRTPKYNIISPEDAWQKTAYRVSSFSWLMVFEGLLCLYFLFGIYLDIQFRNFGLLPFHVLLISGFGAVFFYSVKHSRAA